MSYFSDLDEWLTGVLVVSEEDDTEEQYIARIKKQIKERVLESYRNGQKAGTTPAVRVAPETREAKPRTFWQSRKAKRP